MTVVVFLVVLIALAIIFLLLIFFGSKECKIIGATLLLLLVLLFPYYIYCGKIFLESIISVNPGETFRSRALDMYKDLFHFELVEYVKYDKQTYKRPIIFMVNHIHQSLLDSISVLLINQTNARIVSTISQSDLIGGIVNSINYINIKHGNGYQMLLDKGTEALQKGDNLIIFPEGKYAYKKKHWTFLETFQTGCFDLALKNNSLIVPIIIEGFRDNNFFITPGSFRIHYLKPIDCAGHSSDSLRELTRKNMNDKLSELKE